MKRRYQVVGRKIIGYMESERSAVFLVRRQEE